VRAIGVRVGVLVDTVDWLSEGGGWVGVGWWRGGVVVIGGLMVGSGRSPFHPAERGSPTHLKISGGRLDHTVLSQPCI
jgi:hypothetical protein